MPHIKNFTEMYLLIMCEKLKNEAPKFENTSLKLKHKFLVVLTIM